MESPDATWAPQSPDLSSYHSADTEPIHPQHQGYRGSISHATPYSPPGSSPTLQTKPSLPPPPTGYMPRGVKKEESMQDAEYVPDAPVPPPKGKQKEGNGTSGVLPPGAENVNITVHFPVARIKRIMQADDDVGKVAQVTPVVVSKALELFMISLVTKAAGEAKARGSKRVGAVHLKQAITKDEQFDFLNEIVAKVADVSAAADKSEGDAMDVDGKGKKKSSGRRKKKSDDDDY